MIAREKILLFALRHLALCSLPSPKYLHPVSFSDKLFIPMMSAWLIKRRKIATFPSGSRSTVIRVLSCSLTGLFRGKPAACCELPDEEAHVPKSWCLQPTATRVSLEADPPQAEPCIDGSPVQHLDCRLVRDWTTGTLSCACYYPWLVETAR